MRGTAHLDSVYRPTIRVVNRTVYISGNYVLPLDSAGFLNTNGAGYPSLSIQGLWLGSEGYSVSTSQKAETRVPVFPTALRPESYVTVFRNNPLGRNMAVSGTRYRLNTYISFFVLPNGNFFFESIEANERAGLTSGGYLKASPLRKTISKFENGDFIADYGSYFNSFDAPPPLGISKAVATPFATAYLFDHDSSKSENLGAYFVPVETSWQVPASFTQEQIITAFDSI